jgi:hypothetical protein
VTTEQLRAGREPVAVYQDFARRIRAMLGIAASLFEGQAPPLTAWGELYGWSRPEKFTGLRDYVRTMNAEERGFALWQLRWFLCQEVSFWLSACGLVSILDWGQSDERAIPSLSLLYRDRYQGTLRIREWIEDPSRERPLPLLDASMDSSWRSSPRMSPLVSCILLHVLAMITSRGGIYLCNVCHRPFNPQGERRPRVTRARLCGRPECKQERHREIAGASARKSRQAGGKTQSAG